MPPATANYPRGPELDFRALPYPARLAKAQWLMNQLGYGPDNHLRLTLETFDEPNNKRIAAVAQAMFKQIWVDINVVAIDASVHGFHNRSAGDFDLGAASWFADFDRRNQLPGPSCARTPASITGFATQSRLRPRPRRRPAGAGRRQAQPAARRRGGHGPEKDTPWIPLRFRTTQISFFQQKVGWIMSPAASIAPAGCGSRRIRVASP